MPTFFGKLTGRHYDSIEALRHAEGREAMRRTARTPAQVDYDNLPAEKIREHFDRLSADEQTKAAQVQCVIDLAAFLQEYADEYEDSVENGEENAVRPQDEIRH